jgi:hypothetical protein
MWVKNLIFSLVFLSPSMVTAQETMYYFVINEPLGIEVDPMKERIDAWTAAAESIGRSVPEDWGNHELQWDLGCCEPGVSGLPIEPYPSNTVNGISLAKHSNVGSLASFSHLDEIKGGINFTRTGITSLEPLTGVKITRGGRSHQHVRLYGIGLASLKGLELLDDMGYVYFNDNNLEHVDELISFTKADVITFADNKLKNINGLSSLRRTSRIDFTGNPNLNDLSPLNGVTSFGSPFIAEDRSYTTKMSGSSLICQQFLNSTSTARTRDINGDVVDMDSNNICAY